MTSYDSKNIRVSPFYAPSDPASDVLFITSQDMTRREFVFWQCLLSSIGASVDFWDISRYNGLSIDSLTGLPHSVSWKGHYNGKMILFPHCNLDVLSPFDIVEHFHGSTSPLKDLHSSLVIFLPQSVPKEPNDSFLHDHGDKIVQHHIGLAGNMVDIKENEYSGSYVFGLSNSKFSAAKPYIKWEKKRLKRLEKDIPSQSPLVLDRHSHLKKAGSFAWSYGSVDIRYFPILRSCKLLVVDGAGVSMTDMGMDDEHLAPESFEVPLASNYGQTYLATLYGMPLKSKLNLIKSTSEYLAPKTFHLPNGAIMSRAELSAVCVVHEVADEVFECQGKMNRMAILTEDVVNSMDTYLSNGLIVLRMLPLLMNELDVRKLRLNNSQVSKSISAIKQLCSCVQKALKKAGIKIHSLPPLPSLKILMDSSRFHQTNQHFVKDNRWSVPGM